METSNIHPTLEAPPIAAVTPGSCPARGLWAGVSSKTLVDLSTSGSANRVNFFFVHSLSGFAGQDFAALAEELGPHVRFVGVQATSNVMKNPPIHSSVPTLAEYYVNAILDFQPKGSMMLGGWSAGAVLALEMARCIKKRGRDVALLVVVDDGPEKSVSDFVRYCKMVRNFPKAILTKVSMRGSTRNVIKQVRPKSAVEHPADIFFEDISAFPDYQKQFIRRLYDACIAYELTEKYHGQVLVCDAVQQPLFRPRPVKEMWSNIVAEPDITSVTLPGNHVTVMQRPAVSVLARQVLVKIAMIFPQSVNLS
jgi:thioesterase domain-containing protein